jgi:hypothetical protein
MDTGLPPNDAGTCPVCTTPMRWWCEVHSPSISWLEGPVCPECASAPFQVGADPGWAAELDDQTGTGPGQLRAHAAAPWMPSIGEVMLDPTMVPPTPSGDDSVVHVYHGGGATRPGTNIHDHMSLRGSAHVPLAEGDGGMHWGTRLLVASLSMTPGAALSYQGRSAWLAIPAALAGPAALHAVRAQPELTMVLGAILGVAGFWILSRTALVLSLIIVIAGAAGLVLRDRRVAGVVVLGIVLWLLFVDYVPVDLGGRRMPMGGRVPMTESEEGAR